MKEKKIENAEILKCGLIMPISAIDGCDEAHWKEVRNIIEEAIKQLDKNFEIRMVSEKTKANLIQSNIVQAIYEDNVIICDVSGKNPNVMFELGMRIAFNKPVIIIYDGEGGYPFDIANISYIKYPRDLHYHKINKFQEELKDKIKEMLQEKENAFLKAFGTFKTYQPKVETIDLSGSDKLILKGIEDLRKEISKLESYDRNKNFMNTKSSSSSENYKKEFALVEALVYSFKNNFNYEDFEDLYDMRDKILSDEKYKNIRKNLMEKAIDEYFKEEIIKDNI